MAICEAIGSLVLHACARCPGAALTTFVLAVHVLGAYLDGVSQ